MCSGICTAEGKTGLLMPVSRGQTLSFSRATAWGCSLASPTRLCEPVGAGLTGKVSSPLALNVKLYAGNQLLISSEQSNPSALIQGLCESLLTGEAWKTWFIPLPVVACTSDTDRASHPQQKSQTRAGLCCWKGGTRFYHLHSPGSRSFKSKLCWLSLLSNLFSFFPSQFRLTPTQECLPHQQELSSSSTTGEKKTPNQQKKMFWGRVFPVNK